ncbi:ATP-binding protein [Natroniella sulfidigena]|uniref:sensor histidine kinase n=1 Tax=Natroniella sulfidigena TaxID=723921 RepID=UPI00200A67AF|nr:ATP-binding protein [Natroniella sulfidigena]MCK8817407.1 ATP-binding protein [Natroniella sulfidigena]
MIESSKLQIKALVLTLLLQSFLLLWVHQWRISEIINIQDNYLTRIILFMAVCLSILSMIIIRKIFNLVKYELDYKVQEVKLEEKKKMIEAFRSQTHDFSNHLQTIYGMAQLDKTEEIKEYIRSLNKDLATTKYNNLGEDGSILDSLLIPKKLEAVKAKIDFDYQIDQGLREVNLSLDKLFRIVSNLVDNAIEATKSFNGEKVIKVIGKDQEDDYLLRVKNSGPTIEQDVLEKILEPGFSTKDDGRGFGLYIVKSLIEEDGGRIEVRSEAGYGTEFSVLLKKKRISN